MNEQKNKLLLSSILIFCFICCGCLTKTNTNVGNKTGMHMDYMITGLGSLDESNLNRQKLTYTAAISNYNSSTVYIRSVEPVLGNKIKDKVITENLVITVNKKIVTNHSIKLSGDLIINTQGLSKKQILDLEPYILGIKVNSDQIMRR